MIFYKSINTGVLPFAVKPATLPNPAGETSASGKELFNGNIAAMMVNIQKIGEPLLNAYHYDQLNRIVGMDVYKGLNTGTNVWTAVSSPFYKERVSYDANGNILTYLRNGTTAGSKPLAMDNMSYGYIASRNKLRRVTDAVPPSNYTEDIDELTDADNYVYDKIGNLTQDKAEGIDVIDWTVYGKIRQIIKTDGTQIKYTYDASGNRISKAVIPPSSHLTKKIVTTWYVRDATGNVMSVYKYERENSVTGDPSIYELDQTEVHIYGSSRLGIWNTNRSVKSLTLAAGISNFSRGNKFFELSNHLGNVLAVVTDRSLAIPPGSGTVIDHYEADVVSATDYYPFGMVMPGRSFSAINQYRYGFNGKENDKDISEGGQDYGMRIYDGRLGRFLSIDPLTADFADLSPYPFASNSPMVLIDQDGMAGTPGIFGTLEQLKAKLQNAVAVGASIANGTADGLKDANTFGASDRLFWGSWSTDHWEDNEGDQKLGYLLGRAIGATLALEQVATEAGIAGGLAVSGVGIIGGGLLTVHASGVAAAALIDLTKTTAELLKIGITVLKAETATTSDGTNDQANSANRSSDASNSNSTPPAKTKHVDNRHVNRKKYPDKSKYKKPNQIDKINKKTLSKPDLVTVQKKNRVLYQKEMKRVIGTREETVNRVVIDTKKNKIVTAHPAKEIKQ